MEAQHSASRTVRNKFVAGLIILIPIVITVKALWWLFSYVDSLARPVSAAIVGREVSGAGVATTVAIVLLTGILFSTGPLRRLLEGFEDVLESLPVAGTLYLTIKKVLEGFGSPKSKEAFQRFVLVRLPGRTTPGFLTGSFTLRRADGQAQDLCSVYVPTNHLYVGDVVVLSADDVIETDLSVEAGMSVILSAGAAMPPEVKEKQR